MFNNMTYEEVYDRYIQPQKVQAFDEGYQQGRADAIDECKYNTELFREIFLEELERQAVDREEIFMYRNICFMAWNKYLEQLKTEDGGKE